MDELCVRVYVSVCVCDAITYLRAFLEHILQEGSVR